MTVSHSLSRYGDHASRQAFLLALRHGPPNESLLVVGTRALGRCLARREIKNGQDSMQDHDPGVTDNESVLLDTYRRTLQHVDEDGRSRAGQGGELAYHNRFHVAQTLTALSYFLEHSNFETQHRLLALIVMAGHDLGHQGLSNEALGQQQESLTYDLLEPIWHSLTAEQKAWAHQWLVGTDPSLVKANHERFLKQPHDPLLGMQVLINEADVAGSLTSEFGQELTRRLLIERGNPLPTEQDVRETHKQFVSQVPLSSKQARFFLCDEQA